MIKNIIFDMGQVLIKFDPNMFIERVGITNPEDKKILLREIYKSVEWSMMDRGSLTDQEAANLMMQRVPDHLKDKVAKLTYEWDRPIISIDGAYELIKELKENGYKIYLLSNASLNQKNYWPNIPGQEYFDGVVVSAYVNYVKPEHEIYEHLLAKFNLKADECIFIDDSTLNVEGAIHAGLHGIVFHGDYKEVRQKFIENGIEVTL